MTKEEHSRRTKLGMARMSKKPGPEIKWDVERARELRDKGHMTYGAIAAKLGIAKRTVWEQLNKHTVGKRRLSKAQKRAMLINVAKARAALAQQRKAA